MSDEASGGAGLLASRSNRGLIGLVVAVVGLLLAAGAIAWILGQGAPPTPTPGPEAGETTPGTPEDEDGDGGLRRAVVRLAPVTSRSAVLWLDDQRLGTLQLAPDGRVSGDALIRAPARAKRLGLRPVELHRPPELDRAVAEAAQRLFTHSGAGNTTVVDAPPRR